MKMLIKISCLIFLITSLVSCKNDTEDSRQNFIIESALESAGSSKFLVYLSNQSGEVLIDTFGKSIEKVFAINKREEDRVDLTLGIASEHAFNFATYRDIKSGFKIENPWRRRSLDCESEFNVNDEENGVNIEINGIKEYSKVYYPFWGPANIIVDEANDKIIIRGSVLKTDDIFLTLQPEEGGAYKSKIFRLQDYESVNETINISTHIDEFEEPIIYEVDMGIDGTWVPTLEFLTTEGRVLQLWRNSFVNDDFSVGNKVRFFLPANVEAEKVRLYINGSQYLYNKISSELPTSIELYDPIIEVNSTTSNSFDFSVEGDNDLQLYVYTYNRPMHGFSFWNVFQTSEIEDPSYQLPNISSDFLLEFDYIEELLINPSSIEARFYSLPGADIDRLYNEVSIGGEINCIDYLFKRESVYF